MIRSRSAVTLCDVLEWDSTFFGRSVARYRGTRCLAGDAEALAEECAARAIDCVYILIDPSDLESLVTVHRHGAFFADVRLTFGAQTSGREPGSHPSLSPQARPATAADVPVLRRLAAASHRDTRFYADPHFSSDRCDQLYATWIDNSCHGYADSVLVSDGGTSGPVGYVTCHKGQPGRGHIGLFAVADAHQGRGVGRALLAAALAWFSNNGVTSMTVATQRRNTRAVRLYERSGLILSATGFWFHYWPADAQRRMRLRP